MALFDPLSMGILWGLDRPPVDGNSMRILLYRMGPPR